MNSFLKKYHKWLGIVLTLFIILFSLSGIVLNHRETFSKFNVKRSILPQKYQYTNWNNAGVKSTLKIGYDSVLVYGNIGIWLTDSTFTTFTDFNAGFANGIDNRKVAKILKTTKNELFAATFFGLYQFNFTKNRWIKNELPVYEKRVVDLLEKNDTLYVMTRSFLLKTTNYHHFEQVIIPQPEFYDNKISLFKTLWVIHSGEIYGSIGKIFVDVVGVIFIFLSITGLIFFINGYRIKKRRKYSKEFNKIKGINSWNLRWHNKVGWITLIVLIITTLTGMFLRPPLLITIGNVRVNKIPYTELATPNPWFDILRRIVYDDENNRFIIASMNGFFYSDDNFQSKLKKFEVQPPASMMGVTVLYKTKPNTWMVGSFMGLFEWNPKTGYIFDYIKKEPYKPQQNDGRPIGDFKITGFSTDFNNQEIIFDYDFGAINISGNSLFTPMPNNIISNSPLSLWNLALEVHTARIYGSAIGGFYILIIPLVGFVLLFILISGFVVWLKDHKNREKLFETNNEILNNYTMKNKKYTVSHECISCRACVEVAGNNFEMNSNKKAYLKKQPENENEESLCNEAIEVCPVDAISLIDNEQQVNIMPILSKSNIKETLDKYPDLKDVLSDLSPKFKRMQNPALYNTLARFASFADAAKITGLSVCEILHVINRHLGVEDKLIKSMPECMKTDESAKKATSVEISWDESTERYIYNEDSLPEIIGKVSNLQPQQNLVVISVQNPIELLNVSQGLGFKFNIEKTREYRISIFNPQKLEDTNWEDRKDSFEILDVRTMTSDPFDIIIKKAYSVDDDSGFTLIQRFEPYPMINMLSEMGFEHLTEKHADDEVWIYLHKIPVEKTDDDSITDKPDVVIQSATPVSYPVIMRLLQSEKIRKSINIKELKVWEETEKHLAWIANGKADISFSALITSAKLRNSDVKIPALFVWDNFVILTRGYKAKDFNDLIGKTIHTPLFEEAPPAKITKYLIKASGLNTNDFNFVYGEPFGRPEKIYADFVTGIADTVILREPEASYAIKIMKDRGEEISIISYNEIWNKFNKGFGSFPNAGIVLKGEFVRNNPEITKVLLNELKSAINWVNSNRAESAKLSFDMMRQPVDRVELFLDRVNFTYVDGDELVNKVKSYFDILTEQGIVETEIDEEFLDIFRM